MRLRLFLATGIVALTAALGLSACGQDTTTVNLAASPQGKQDPAKDRRWGHRRHRMLTAKQRACVKAKGIDLPARHRHFGPPKGMPKPPKGMPRAPRGHFRLGPRPGMRRHFREFRKEHPELRKRFEKMRKALTACGVKLPRHPPMGPPHPGGPPPGGPPPPER